MKKSITLTIIAGLLSFITFAQSGIITGTVNDGEYNDILPFANVIIKDSQLGALSDFEGKYSLELKPGIYTVQFSFVGYQTLEINEVIVKNGETGFIIENQNPNKLAEKIKWFIDNPEQAILMGDSTRFRGIRELF